MSDERTEAVHPDVHPDDEDRRELIASVTLGGAMLVAAVLILVDAARLPTTSDAVGPGAVPLLVGVLLGAVGAVLAIRAGLRLAGAPHGAPRPAGGAVRVGVMVLVLVVFAVLLPVLGFVLSSAALFAVTALLLGAPSVGRAVAYGWGLAAIVFLVFDRLIGLALPAGPWGF